MWSPQHASCDFSNVLAANQTCMVHEGTVLGGLTGPCPLWAQLRFFPPVPATPFTTDATEDYPGLWAFHTYPPCLSHWTDLLLTDKKKKKKKPTSIT